jgi:hypothetical protein
MGKARFKVTLQAITKYDLWECMQFFISGVSKLWLISYMRLFWTISVTRRKNNKVRFTYALNTETNPQHTKHVPLCHAISVDFLRQNYMFRDMILLQWASTNTQILWTATPFAAGGSDQVLGTSYMIFQLPSTKHPTEGHAMFTKLEIQKDKPALLQCSQRTLYSSLTFLMLNSHMLIVNLLKKSADVISILDQSKSKLWRLTT